MIVVTGATGKLGGMVVERLLERVPAGELGVSVRDPPKAKKLEERGVRVRRGDFAEPGTGGAGSLREAFAGADTLLLVSSNAQAYGGDVLAQHRAAVEAAQAAGVGRVVYTSHMAAGRDSVFPPMQSHVETEGMLRESGLGWVSLRNGFYAESALFFLGKEWREGRVAVPADGKVSWTTHEDLAEAAARVLVGEVEVEDGPTAPLVGGQAMDLGDLAGVAGELLGRPVRREVVEDGAFVEGMVAGGAPRGLAEMLMLFYEGSRRGEFLAVDGTLERWLGRPTVPVREVLARAAGPG